MLPPSPEIHPPEKPALPLRAWHYGLLVLPFVGLLVPYLYARWTPELWGFPFFYAYQFLWICLSAALTGVVYRSIYK